VARAAKTHHFHPQAWISAGKKRNHERTRLKVVAPPCSHPAVGFVFSNRPGQSRIAFVSVRIAKTIAKSHVGLETSALIPRLGSFFQIGLAAPELGSYRKNPVDLGTLAV